MMMRLAYSVVVLRLSLFNIIIYLVLLASSSRASFVDTHYAGLSINKCTISPATLVRGKVKRRLAQQKDDQDRARRPQCPTTDEKYQSRSTFFPDESCDFYEGSQERAQRLDQALRDIGVDPAADLLQDPIWKGSAALRTYSSFVLPKSAGALAMTQQPQRAAVVANSISFLMREYRAHHDAWIRNHDRSLQEADEIWSAQLTDSSSSNNNRGNKRNPIILILDDIRSAANVGNIFRCAEAARCQQVLLCGSMTPSPPHAAVLKTAVGAAEYVPFQKVASTLQAVRELKQQYSNNTTVLGVETTSKSIPLWQVDLFPPNQQQQGDHYQIAFVFGNELVGVDTNVLQECDVVVSVPTYGIKNSLNVATCVSIVLWEALRQREQIKQYSANDLSC